MSNAVDRRLERLEREISPERGRVYISAADDWTEERRRQEIDARIADERMAPDDDVTWIVREFFAAPLRDGDVVICTGVPRSWDLS